ncbi:methyl-accepting chemotaxis protein [Rhizobium sp. RU36D]|uniref:methyl-accepting chemotaxis protein n=1 Tax=Rhizobium sp. RU36D TaxID=1907415 RepID=UPI0009D7C355|nr:methyl-accepting chemotaxis protein [Rhizobium sp. RU36D]SMD17807.1 Methyl-accepting chemotaxis protein [Rhizobium sp. RU36D]
MKNITLKTRIFGLAAVLLLLLAALSVFAFVSVRDLADKTARIDRFYRAVGQVFLADRDFTGFRLRTNAVMSFSREPDFQRSQAQSQFIDEALGKAAALVTGEEETRQIADLQAGLRDYKESFTRLMQQRRALAEDAKTLAAALSKLQPAATPDAAPAMTAIAAAVLASETLSSQTVVAAQTALKAASSAPASDKDVSEALADAQALTDGLATLIADAGLGAADSVSPKEREVLTKIADLRAFLLQQIDAISASVAADTVRTQVILAIVVALGILTGLTVAVLIARSIITPIRQMTHAMTRLAEGDGKVEIPGLGNATEIGEMAAAVDVFKQNADKIATMLQAEDTTREIGAVISRAAGGDLTVRVNLDGKTGFLRDIGEQVNQLLQVSHSSFRDFGDKARSTAISVGEASMAVGQVSEGARAQNGSLTQVAGAVKEALLAIGEVSDNTRLASEKADNAIQLVERGLASVENMSSIVERIAQNSRKVNQITQVIAQIANRTHILSLNAAIEAARAGEHGKGFVVVAQEVGKLAESAGQNANQIAEIVEQAADDTLAGKAAADVVRAAIQGISGETRQTTQMIHASVAAIEQQRSSITQIDGNVSDLKLIANSNAAAAEEITATMVQLSRLADETRQRIDAFKMN